MVCPHVCCAWCSQKSEEGIGSPLDWRWLRVAILVLGIKFGSSALQPLVKVINGLGQMIPLKKKYYTF